MPLTAVGTLQCLALFLQFITLKAEKILAAFPAAQITSHGCYLLVVFSPRIIPHIREKIKA
jgi:hypothetical protein